MNRRLFLAAVALYGSAAAAQPPPAHLRRRVSGHNFYFTPIECDVEYIYPVREMKDGDSPGFHTTAGTEGGEWKLEILRPWFPDMRFKVRADLSGGGSFEFDAVCRPEGVFFER